MTALGYACIEEPGKKLRETNTHSCAHCNRIIHVPIKGLIRTDGSPVRTFEQVADFCRNCMRVICGDKERCRVCVPFEKKLDAHDRAVLSGMFTATQAQELLR